MNSPIEKLIHPLPGYSILHVSSNPDEIITTLVEMVEKVRGRLGLALYDHAEISFNEMIKVQYVDDYNTLFRALPRDHDIVILHEVYAKHTQQEKILKSAYNTLANAAYIIIIEKKGVLDIAKLLEQLEAKEFRASNHIELLEGYDLVMAKKMHMWGNGL